MAKTREEKFTLEPIRPEHAAALTALAKDDKYSPVLGKGYEENKKIAEAFSRSYPKACLIRNEQSKDVGIVVVEHAGNQHLEATLITDDKDLFADVLNQTIMEFKGKYKGIYITPMFPEALVRVSLETRTKIAREKDFLDGTKSKEFKITLI